jgi:hypothetical protein
MELFPQRIDEDNTDNNPVCILNHIVEPPDLTHVKNFIVILRYKQIKIAI